MSIISSVDKNTHLIDAYYAAPHHSCVYLVEDGGEYAIIDAGTALSAKYILAALQELKVAPEAVKYILPTHVHLDHAGGVGVLCQHLPNAQVYVHPLGRRHLIDPEKLAKASVVIYGEEMMKFAVGHTEPTPAERCHELSDGQELEVGQIKILTQFTPGHAKHHCGFFDQTNGNYYGGDVLGNSYPMMRSDNKHLMFLCSAPVDYDGELWHKSLDLIAAVKPKRGCLCHYGVLDNPQQAIADMHKLIDKSDERALKLVELEDDQERRRAVEQMVWGLFWEEHKSFNSPMHEEQAKQWMVKDVHIATEGVSHWLKQKRADK